MKEIFFNRLTFVEHVYVSLNIGFLIWTLQNLAFYRRNPYYRFLIGF